MKLRGATPPSLASGGFTGVTIHGTRLETIRQKLHIAQDLSRILFAAMDHFAPCVVRADNLTLGHQALVFCVEATQMTEPCKPVSTLVIGIM